MLQQRQPAVEGADRCARCGRTRVVRWVAGPQGGTARLECPNCRTLVTI